MKIDKRRMIGTVTMTNDEGDEIEVELPLAFEMCCHCNGKGTHVNPNVDGHGLTSADFDEDPEFRENYFSGAYDVTCHECSGDHVVPVVDESKKLTPLQSRAMQFEVEMEIERENDRRTRFYENGGYGCY